MPEADWEFRLNSEIATIRPVPDPRAHGKAGSARPFIPDEIGEAK
jgi:hypothetical protein